MQNPSSATMATFSAEGAQTSLPPNFNPILNVAHTSESVEDGYDESEVRGWDNADGVSIMNRPH